MKERPILFSAPMVQALLSGSKTQTRRVCHPPKGVDPKHWMPRPVWGGFEALHWPADDAVTDQLRCPYGQVGDQLWVREAFSYDSFDIDKDGTFPAWYWADGNPEHGDFTKPKPLIHMPRWASRIQLEITGIRVERLHEITEADAIAEGTPWNDNAGNNVEGYRLLWESINGAGSWESNPWVWVVEFKVIKPAPSA